MPAPTPESDTGFATIRPVAVTPSEGQGTGRSVSAPLQGISARTVLVALVAVVLTGLLLIVGLPWMLQPSEAPAARADSATGIPVAEAEPDADVPQAAAAPTPAPWDDPAALAARAAAQALAASVAERRADLEAKVVSRWAEVAFQAAVGDADAAAALFVAREFIAAEARYAEADAALEVLQSQAGDVRDHALAEAEAGLQAGDAAAVAAPLELAAAMAADDPRVRALSARLEALPDVLRALAAAEGAERSGAWAEAARHYQAALALDAQMQPARDGAARVAAQMATGRFQAAMSEALRALDAGQLDAAGRALERAAGERPRDPALTAARTRLAEARRDQQMRSRLDQAQAAVAQEQWAAAVRHFESVLELDPHHAAAQTALGIARPRAAMAMRLQALIDGSERLASVSVRDDADRTLAAARALSPRGDRIQAQIEAVARLLDQARTPVPVRLLSDNATDVTLFRVGAQGRFSEKPLELLPGRYVAVGERRGYRDVRVEFEVKPGQPVTVAVRTEERL